MQTKRSRVHAIIGTVAMILLAAVFGMSIWQNHRDQKETPKHEVSQGLVLKFDPEELVYDGEGELDLMEGVKAFSEDGTDLTDQVTAVLTGNGTQTNKVVRYSVFDENGQETTKRRDLKFVNYKGPSISVEEQLELKAENMQNLTSYLKEEGMLVGEDGFGRDITDQITWMREKISQGAYEITFSYINDYQDSVEVVVNANVSGALEDLTVTLQSEAVDIPVGAEFVAEDYIQEISDPSGNGSNVSVSSNVDTLHEGTYEVRYTVISTDRTQKAIKVLKVTVR